MNRLKTILIQEGLMKRAAGPMSESEFWKTVDRYKGLTPKNRAVQTLRDIQRFAPDMEKAEAWRQSFIDRWNLLSGAMSKELRGVRNAYYGPAIAINAGKAYYQEAMRDITRFPKFNSSGTMKPKPGGLPKPKLSRGYAKEPKEMIVFDEYWSREPPPGFVDPGAGDVMGDPDDVVAQAIVYGGKSYDYTRSEVAEMLDNKNRYADADNLPKWMRWSGMMDDWGKVWKYLKKLVNHQGPAVTINVRSDDRSVNAIPRL